MMINYICEKNKKKDEDYRNSLEYQKRCESPLAKTERRKFLEKVNQSILTEFEVKDIG